MKFFTSWKIVLLVLIGLIALRIQDGWLVEIARLKTFDYYQVQKGQTPSDQIAIVEITDDDIENFGQWPWPRDKVAFIIDSIKAFKPALIVMPIIFSEPDRFGKDQDLANALEGVVISQAPSNKASNDEGSSRGIAVVGESPLKWLQKFNGVVRPLKMFEEKAVGVGVLAASGELDGVVRRIPMVVRIDKKNPKKGFYEELYPTLSLEVIRSLTGDPSYQMKVGINGVESVRIPKFEIINTDSNARVWIKYDKEFDRRLIYHMDDIENKIVILTISAEGLATNVPTPYGTRNIADVQAAMISTLINGDSLTRLDYADAIELITLSLIGLLFIVLVPKLKIWQTIPFFAAISAGIVGFCFYMYEMNILFDYSFPLFTITLVFAWLVFNNFAREFRLKQQIKKQFQSYLSKALVEKLQKNPELLKLGGDSRELSIMFTDVRGFTSISEHYGENVQGLTQIMNRYMTAMTAKILENEGTLDKYIGDAQMAFWNAPLDDKQHAKNAVKTALSMLGDLDEFNRSIAAEGVPPFGMGLGINTGMVVVGNMGSDQRFDYTCLGDAVNLASRLEGQSKPYGVKLVVGPKTAEYVADEYFVIELDTIAVKGKKQGVNIYTVIGTNREMEFLNYAPFREMHNVMLDDYRSKNFTRALLSCEKLMTAFNGQMKNYYSMMIERCEDYIKNPPPADWDGVYRATSK
jgi:adenylate cyclase